MAFEFRPIPAVTDAGERAPEGAGGQVFAPSDTSFTTPLTVQNSAGVNTTTITVSSQGLTSRFTHATYAHLIWKAGSYIVDLYSLSGMMADVAASAAASAVSATAAAATADEVETLRKWVELGVTRRNYIRDPRALAVGSTWGYQLGTGEAATTTPITGASDGPVLPDGSRITSYIRRTITTPKTGTSSGPWLRTTQNDMLLAEGEQFSAAFYVRFSQAVTVQVSVSNRASGAGGSSSLQSYTLPANTWVRVGRDDTAEVAGDQLQVWAVVGSTTILPAGTTIDTTGGQAQRGALSDHFDGHMAPSTNKGYRFSGEPDASISEMIDMTILSPEGVVADWTRITNKPGVFPPAAHTHDPATAFSGTGLIPISRIASGTPTGTKFVRDDGTLAEPPGTGGGGGGGSWDSITGKPSTFPPSSHSHPATQISDASAVGRAVITAVDAATARAQIGAGTSSVTVGGLLSGAAAAASHTHTPAQAGLGNVANVAPADLPISTATAAALDGKAPLSHTHTQAQVSGLSTALTARVQVVQVVTGSEARPSGSSVVLWVGGATQPASMAAGDVWLKEV